MFTRGLGAEKWAEVAELAVGTAIVLAALYLLSNVRSPRDGEAVSGCLRGFLIILLSTDTCKYYVLLASSAAYLIAFSLRV